MIKEKWKGGNVELPRSKGKQPSRKKPQKYDSGFKEWVEQAVSPLCIKSDGEEILTFAFRTLPLFNLEAEQFVQEHRACMYPLLPTMKGVHAELITQVMQELTELYRDNGISLAHQFSWMTVLLERTDTIKPLEKERIEERLKMFDQLWEESPRVQKTKLQAREEALKEARQEAEQAIAKRLQEAEQAFAKRLQEAEHERMRMQQQEVKVRRSSLVSVTHARFPDLTEFAQRHVESFDKPEVLDLLIQQIAVAPDANTARLLLNPRPEAQE
jgi:hypothetical protein